MVPGRAKQRKARSLGESGVCFWLRIWTLGGYSVCSLDRLTRTVKATTRLPAQRPNPEPKADSAFPEASSFSLLSPPWNHDPCPGMRCMLAVWHSIHRFPGVSTEKSGCISGTSWQPKQIPAVGLGSKLLPWLLWQVEHSTPFLPWFWVIQVLATSALTYS